MKIIYEDKDMLVIDKPSGMMAHPDGKNTEETVSEWVVKNYPETKGVGEEMTLQNGEVIERPGIVHRLDRETSGTMIIAKNQESFLHLKEQFQKRLVTKKYSAFVYGEMKNDEDIIERPIGRSKRGLRLWSAQPGAGGTLREAVTEYSVIKRGGGYSLIEARPKTGRTHQIRVHMKAINYPIVCDKLYAPKRECALGFNRLALHAKSLEIIMANGEKRVFEAELTEDFNKALDMIENA